MINEAVHISFLQFDLWFGISYTKDAKNYMQQLEIKEIFKCTFCPFPVNWHDRRGISDVNGMPVKSFPITSHSSADSLMSFRCIACLCQLNQSDVDD